MSDKTPYWFPVLCDGDYFARLRSDYPENAHMSDEELHDYYNDGLKYQNLWDHTGDAYSDYEPLADSYLEILAALKGMVQRFELYAGENDIHAGHHDKALLDKARAAISIAEGADE